MKKVKFKKYNCVLSVSKYTEGGGKALMLLDEETGEPIAKCTVNLPEEKISKDEAFIKDYGENSGMLKALVEAQAVEDLGETVSLRYPTHTVDYQKVRIL